MNLAGRFEAWLLDPKDKQAAVGHVVHASSQASGRAAAKPQHSQRPAPTVSAGSVYLHLYTADYKSSVFIHRGKSTLKPAI